MTAAPPLPEHFRVLCTACGVTQPVANFGRGQMKKKHPRCRACAPNKFSNQQTGAHQSKKESRRAQHLHTLEAAKLIRDLKEQVTFELIPAQLDGQGTTIERRCTYVADYTYTDAEGRFHVEDAKGMRTDVYRIKRKLMLQIHKIRIEEV